MYFDQRPCAVCGAQVELRANEPALAADDGPVGPADGVVGGADSTVDERFCTNPECPTHDAVSGN